ncbi:signal transduction histidine kinase [Paenibacillus anaericanus]|uniref:HAMP domain-containing sensor histidine kinase n=1 Tax=Paenibacillus anaericanus TaxID=170367 RepID=UPI0027889B6D|nr:HAMP domain-containing sensor histidine kinase [Paenibacillus anaericanus]MDQ0089585.1 signal transduction histidine kinase [Paenibacillus anaericanus]
MKSKWMIGFIAIILGVGITVSVLLMNRQIETNVDTVAINNIVKQVESHWEYIDQGDYSNVSQPFVVMDLTEKVLYTTEDHLASSVNEGIRNRDTIVDVVVNGTIVGKVIVPNNSNNILRQWQQELLIVILAAFLAIALLSIAYVRYLNRTVVRPFHKLKDFARNVANGNLDIPLDIDKNNLFGAFSESFDMMREELAAARQSEYRANRSKKELVASLSHDIKTPVASIKAVSELMLVLTTSEKERKQLNTIYAKAEQIDLLVTDMFHATLEELEELKVTVVDEHSSALQKLIESSNYYGKIEWDDIPECIIHTDTARLQQVFDNILSNSYKYANTSVRITFKIASSYLEVIIMDYGMGVPEDELPLLFNKFYRGHDVTGQSGTGLGLYISKYIMEKMESHITCYNRTDGFSVMLQIPLS